jgi:lysine 2,3-aminomutase
MSTIALPRPNMRTPPLIMGRRIAGDPARRSYDRVAAPFPTNAAAEAFRRRFFPGVGRPEWNDWRWQLRNRLRTVDDLARIFSLSESERLAASAHKGPLPVGITPYYAHLLDRSDSTQGLRRTHIPDAREGIVANDEQVDPLAEDRQSPVPGLVHRYPDRVLFLVTGSCATYCRYCTRSRMVGEPGGPYSFSQPQWEKALDYIQSNTAIRDVLLSGGDPLLLATEKLGWLLDRLRRIPHVEFIRIGTKIPAVLPQRITSELAKVLRADVPVWLSLHVTHPDELTAEMKHAVGVLADAGLPLGSQTVLLKGINDSAATMKQLMHGLLKMRIRPYYLYQCDHIPGSAHFRTSVGKGREIIGQLQGHTTGYAVPTFVVDTPGGKIPVMPTRVVSEDARDVVLQNYLGDQYDFAVDPEGSASGSTS